MKQVSSRRTSRSWWEQRLLARRVRNLTWVRDAQLTQNALGIFWVATGRNIVGWGMICLAATRLAHVWVNVCVRRPPFPETLQPQEC